MTETVVSILISGGIITAFVIMAIWAVKLYVKNKRAGITHAETKPIDWDDPDADFEQARRPIDEYLPGGLDWMATHKDDK